MTRSLRALLGLAAVAAAASVAGAQTAQPQQESQPPADRAAATAGSQKHAQRAKPARRYRTVSRKVPPDSRITVPIIAPSNSSRRNVPATGLRPGTRKVMSSVHAAR